MRRPPGPVLCATASASEWVPGCRATKSHERHERKNARKTEYSHPFRVVRAFRGQFFDFSDFVSETKSEEAGSLSRLTARRHLTGRFGAAMRGTAGRIACARQPADWTAPSISELRYGKKSVKPRYLSGFLREIGFPLGMANPITHGKSGRMTDSGTDFISLRSGQRISYPDDEVVWTFGETIAPSSEKRTSNTHRAAAHSGKYRTRNNYTSHPGRFLRNRNWLAAAEFVNSIFAASHRSFFSTRRAIVPSRIVSAKG